MQIRSVFEVMLMADQPSSKERTGVSVPVAIIMQNNHKTQSLNRNVFISRVCELAGWFFPSQGGSLRLSVIRCV